MIAGVSANLSLGARRDKTRVYNAVLLQALLGIALAAQMAAGQPALKSPPVIKAEPVGPAYKIGPGDVLQIDVWKEADVSTPSVTVRPDGRVSLPMAGELAVAGLTPAEVEKALTQRFGALIRDPRVTVSVREANSQKAYVIGEVRREGPIRMAGPMTVLQALAEAGGLNDYANRKHIYVLRVVNGRQTNLAFNYEAVVRGQMMQQNITLLPGDTVVVPR